MNRVNIEATKFVNLSGETSYGYRIYDNYGASYCDLSPCMIEDDLELLELVMAYADEDTKHMIDEVKVEEKSVFINGEEYDFESIREIMENEE